MINSNKHILLSNDDGIDSPGLWAAAESLSDLGYVTVAAPRDHMSAMGRGFQRDSDGMIAKKQLTVHGKVWEIFSVGGSPSQSVAHGILELSPIRPDLVVSGINYGENFGNDVTLSGTVGAAIEGASLGIPGLAVSQQIIFENMDSFDNDVDFTISAHFTKYFANLMLENQLPRDVHLLNVVVPNGATVETPWKVVPLANTRYFRPRISRSGTLEEQGEITPYILDHAEIEPNTDIHTVIVEKMVAVTPLSINLTSRTDLNQLETLLRS